MRWKPPWAESQPMEGAGCPRGYAVDTLSLGLHHSGAGTHLYNKVVVEGILGDISGPNPIPYYSRSLGLFAAFFFMVNTSSVARVNPVTCVLALYSGMVGQRPVPESW